MMNDKDQQIVTEMIKYVEEEERELQAAKMGSQSKRKAVTDIMKELEKKIKNAN